MLLDDEYCRVPRIAVMQPYFLPYIGYYQLIASVDKFVILDDVNYINRGWINRNRIAKDNGSQWITLPLSGASQNRLIRDIDILPDDGWKSRLIRIVGGTYSRSSNSEFIQQFIDWIDRASGNLSEYLYTLIKDTCELCKINTEIVRTSSIYPKGSAKGQQRILEICRSENARVYINPPGGTELYDAELFARSGIELKFLVPKTDGLNTSSSEGAVLSILDIFLNNPAEQIACAVNDYKLS